MPGLRCRQRLMPAGVERAPVAHQAHVVGMPQQRVQVRDGQRFAASPSGCRRQTTVGQLGPQAPDRPVSSRVGIERPSHQRPALGIDLDRAGFAPVLELADVQVARERSTRRAAVLGLLRGALDDLRGQVAAVELADRRHDAVQQQPGRRLVDVLGDRHQLGASLPDRHVDRHVISTVACQAVDLVDDDVLDVVLCDVGEHPL
jgi:hypothetical protein